MPCVGCRRFKLLCQIRVTYRFAALKGRRQLVANRLMAFVVYMQANPSHEELATFFMGETELISELISLVEADAGVDEAIRMLALKALAVQAGPPSCSLHAEPVSGRHWTGQPLLMWFDGSTRTQSQTQGSAYLVKHHYTKHNSSYPAHPAQPCLR